MILPARFRHRIELFLLTSGYPRAHCWSQRGRRKSLSRVLVDRTDQVGGERDVERCDRLGFLIVGHGLATQAALHRRCD